MHTLQENVFSEQVSHWCVARTPNYHGKKFKTLLPNIESLKQRIIHINSSHFEIYHTLDTNGRPKKIIKRERNGETQQYQCIEIQTWKSMIQRMQSLSTRVMPW